MSSGMITAQAHELGQLAEVVDTKFTPETSAGTLMESPARFLNEVITGTVAKILRNTAAEDNHGTVHVGQAAAWITYAKRLINRLDTEGATQ